MNFENEGHTVPFGDVFQAVASAVAGCEMEHIGNLRENIMHEGVTVGAHQDGRLSDEDVLIVAITSSPESGGEFVASLSPDEGALIVIPAKAKHQVLKIESGTRRSVTAVLTPKNNERGERS